MLIEVIEPPAVEPVSLAEFKKYARVWADLTDDDDLIETLITAARELLELRTARAFITQTIQETRVPRSCGFRVLRDPVLEYVSLSIDGVDVEVPDRFVAPCNGASPVYELPVDGRVVVLTYKAGYGPTPADVPKTVRLAILMLATHFYDQRAATEDLPPLIATLANSFSWGGEGPPR